MNNEELIDQLEDNQEKSKGAEQFLSNCENLLNLAKELGMDESTASMAFSLNIAVMIEEEDMALALVRATYKQLRDSYQEAKTEEGTDNL
jgi:hypothetical protein